MNLMKMYQRFKSSKVSIALRNALLIRPIAFTMPIYDKASVSDFFFYDCRDGNDTKFTVTNFSSQLFSSSNITEKIKLMIFSDEGDLIFEKNYSLEKNETKEIVFSELKLTSSLGSFCIFHFLSDYEQLISNCSHLSERGYVAYRRKKGVWNYMHGNSTACYFNKNKSISTLVSTSLRKSSYMPQVSFMDVDWFSVILNNPTKKKISFIVECFNLDGELIQDESKEINPLGTKIFDIRRDRVGYIIVKSNIIFCRPVIMKNYSELSFDIFHG